MKEMRTFLAADIVEPEKRMAANLRNIMREETAELRSDFEKKISIELSKKLKSTEKAHDKDINNVKSDIGKLSGKVCEMERTISEVVSKISEDEVACSLVVRNLPLDKREDTDPNITSQLVSRIIRDGLEMGDVHVKKSERKDNKPGVIVFTVETPEQKAKLLKHKKLRENEDYSGVYIDTALSREEQLSRANMQTIIRTVGKDRDLRFHGKGPVPVKDA
ncbi:hypothetical protein SNE40_008116 [Patella caerulea]|uniref:Uncharacterized protein n=1 Tax=Patella caerulea TaxID=87958 RepID=A0AAN8Q3A9_PATCE